MCTANNPNLPCSPYTLNYFPRILQSRRKNEESAEIIFHYQQCLGTSKGHFRKNGLGGYILPYKEQFTKFIFWLSLKQKLLYAHTETTLNGEISTVNTESLYISVNNNRDLKKN